MTFEEALNSTSKQIEYLGGLKAFIPYMPFPVPLSVDDIREKSEKILILCRTTIGIKLQQQAI